SAEMSPEVSMDGSGEIEVKLDGELLAPPPDFASAASSLLQDLEQLPPEWLQPAGDGKYDRRGGAGEADDAARANDENANRGVFRYDEWDFHRESYRKKWCALRERDAHPLHDGFVDDTLKKYAHLVADIRRSFEALRDARKLLKAQPDGDGVDFDALVTAHADARAGAEMSERLFTRAHKAERDLAVIFMVDVSGSTKGWINDAERESLALLCEALEALGDRYAIYAFSGMTRNRCEVYPVKTFAQPYDADARARIGGLRPQDYTRMGATIRHLTQIFGRVEARAKILITLSDGKPDDYDGYRGDYGIEDTRRALMEARHAGIRPFCITIDERAAEYLPHMYGRARYAVVSDVQKLPLKVADIYRRLTT
ncbi:MAG: VWA domain-containing protein, partial [Gammaproteobacteria bacterium]|nr:VWA domain-containing protein [Gammaproteobacteria bacterium]